MSNKKGRCCEIGCLINKGFCDRQHRCPGCKLFIHAICGHDYYDKAGNVVENLAFPKMCTKYHLADSNDGTTTPKKGSQTGNIRGGIGKDATSNGNEGEGNDSSSGGSKPNRRNKRNHFSSGDNNVNKVAPAKKKIHVPTPNPNSDTETEFDDEDADSGTEIVDDFFNEEERKKFKPGYFLVNDLKRRGELLMDRLSMISPEFDDRCKLKNRVVNIPATYWGGEDKIQSLKDQWWKTASHTDELRVLSPAQIMKTLLFGKVIGKGNKGCWEVCLLCAPKEISMIHGRDIRNYLYVGESKSASSGGESNKRSNNKVRRRVSPRSRSKNSQMNNEALNSIDEEDGEDELEYDEDELIEVDEFESEDDLQESDGDDSEDAEDLSSDDDSSEGDNDVVDKDFLRVEPRIKVESKWNVVDEVRETNYSKAVIPSFVNTVEINEWKNKTPWDIFQLQLPENEFALWAKYTSKNLLQINQRPMDESEMKLFVGCLFACTQSRKIGGITKAFETVYLMDCSQQVILVDLE